METCSVNATVLSELSVYAGFDINFISYLPCRANREKINLAGTVFWLPESFVVCSDTLKSKTPKQSKTVVHSFMSFLKIHALCGINLLLLF